MSSPNTQKYIVSCRVKIILYAFHKGIENEWCFPKPNWIIMKTPYKTYTSQTHVKPFTLWTSNNISYRHLAVKASEQDSILHHFRVQQMVPTDQTPFVTAKCFMFLLFFFFFNQAQSKSKMLNFLNGYFYLGWKWQKFYREYTAGQGYHKGKTTTSNFSSGYLEELTCTLTKPAPAFFLL